MNSPKRSLSPPNQPRNRLALPKCNYKELPLHWNPLTDMKEPQPCHVRSLPFIIDRLSTKKMNKITSQRNLVVFPTDEDGLPGLLVRLVTRMYVITTRPTDLAIELGGSVMSSTKTLPIRIVALPKIYMKLPTRKDDPVDETTALITKFRSFVVLKALKIRV